LKTCPGDVNAQDESLLKHDFIKFLKVQWLYFVFS